MTTAMEKNTFKRRLVSWILDQRFFLLGLILLGSIIGGYLLRDPMGLFQNYTEDSREDSGGEAYKEFANQFGDGELLRAVIQSKDIFSAEILSYIASLTRQIEQLANVQKVQSIINAREINVDSGALKT